MARAYIVLLRNDLGDNFLQALDLVPNESQRPFPYSLAGQTLYVSTYLLDGVNAPVATTAGAYDADSYGLSTYLKANVEDGAAGPALTDAIAIAAADEIRGVAAQGSALDLARIDLALSNAGAAGTLTGGASTGSVEEVLRILSGERYKAPGGAVVDAAGVFVPGTGFFTTAPNVEGPGSVRNTYGAVRGRNPFTGGAMIPQAPPVQEGPADVNHNFIRPLFDAGELHRSTTEGALANMKASAFTFLNPDFTYGAGGTALALDGTTVIPTTGQSPAVVVYAADGTVL